MQLVLSAKSSSERQCLDRSSAQSQSWQAKAAEDDPEPGSDLCSRVSELVSEGGTNTSAASFAGRPPSTADDWRSLEAYPPSPDSPRYQPFAERMMGSPGRAHATARQQQDENSSRDQRSRPDAAGGCEGRQHAERPAAASLQWLSTGVGGDEQRLADQQQDSQAAATAAVQRLGSFGPWYERTLAAMTNLQPLGSGPLGHQPPDGGAGSGSWADGKSAGSVGTGVGAKPPPLDRHALAQALLPDPTHVAPYTGERSSTRGWCK